MSLRIVIVERSPALRAGLANQLGTEPTMTVEATVDSARSAEALPRHITADVILLGVDETQIDDISAVEGLVARFPTAQVVVLGPGNEPGVIIAMLRSGADGYLTRETSARGLVRAVRAVAQGEAALPRGLTRLLIETIRFGSQATPGGVSEQLSPREREVFVEIVRGSSNLEIAERLGVSENTVKTHVSRILRKTGSRSRFVLQVARRD